MQHECDVIRLRKPAQPRSLSHRITNQIEMDRGTVWTSSQLGDWDFEFFGHGTSRRIAPFLDDQQADFEIRHVELELLFSIGRIERRGGGPSGDGGKGYCHFRSVGQNDGHRVVSPDAKLIETADCVCDLSPQIRIGEWLAPRTGDGDRLILSDLQQIDDRVVSDMVKPNFKLWDR